MSSINDLGRELLQEFKEVAAQDPTKNFDPNLIKRIQNTMEKLFKEKWIALNLNTVPMKRSFQAQCKVIGEFVTSLIDEGDRKEHDVNQLKKSLKELNSLAKETSRAMLINSQALPWRPKAIGSIVQKLKEESKLKEAEEIFIQTCQERPLREAITAETVMALPGIVFRFPDYFTCDYPKVLGIIKKIPLEAQRECLFHLLFRAYSFGRIEDNPDPVALQEILNDEDIKPEEAVFWCRPPQIFITDEIVTRLVFNGADLEKLKTNLEKFYAKDSRVIAPLMKAVEDAAAIREQALKEISFSTSETIDRATQLGRDPMRIVSSYLPVPRKQLCELCYKLAASKPKSA